MIHRIVVVFFIAWIVHSIYFNNYTLAGHQAALVLLLIWGREDAQDAAYFRALVRFRLKFIPMPDGKFWIESQTGDGCGHADPREAVVQAMQEVER